MTREGIRDGTNTKEMLMALDKRAMQPTECQLLQSLPQSAFAKCTTLLAYLPTQVATLVPFRYCSTCFAASQCM